jgi:hypothetical protein
MEIKEKKKKKKKSVTSLAETGEGVKPARKINYTKFCRVGEM